MNRPIYLSPKYNLNPSIDCCFFCGKNKGVAIFGKLPKDEKAPTKVITDYQPCSECRQKMAQGITLIGVAKESKTLVPIRTLPDGTKLYPTGAWAVIAEASVDRIFRPEAAETVKKQKCAFLDEALLEKLTGESK